MKEQINAEEKICYCRCHAPKNRRNLKEDQCQLCGCLSPEYELQQLKAMNQMKEQVSVELKPCPFCGSQQIIKGFKDCILSFFNEEMGGIESPIEIFCNNEECNKLLYIDPIKHWNARAIDIAEYDRLKRLDENVKAFTLGLKHGLPNLIDKSNEEIVKQIIRELESLDK